MNARNLGFRTGSFDLAICGFMGWDDCFDFTRMEFTRADTKGKEILRVLRDGGRFTCCSWEVQQDVTWMEDAILRHYPAILEDPEYLANRPIGMSYEKAQGCEIIFRAAGFREIKIDQEQMTFVSTDEEEWWRQKLHLGWDEHLEKIDPDRLKELKEAIFRDLQVFRHADGLHFDKLVFFVSGKK